jgi:arylsulfatase A-like enzyme
MIPSLAAALTASLMILQAAIGSRAMFLGADMSSVASGLLAIRPWAAVGEVFRVFLVITLALSLLGWSALPAWSRSRRGKTKATLILSCLLGYLFLLTHTLVMYPVLFEPWLSHGMSTFIYQQAFHARPSTLLWVGLTLLAGPFLLSALYFATRKQLIVIPAAATACLLLMPALSCHKPLPAGSDKPDIILIIVDSLRGDRATQRRVMPFTQTLTTRARSTTFLDHTIGVPRTVPSTAEILTGRAAPRLGIRHMFPGFPAREKEIPGLATLARDNGYATAIVSDFAGDHFPRYKMGFDKTITPTIGITMMLQLGVDTQFPLFFPLIFSPVGRHLFPALKENPAWADPHHITDDAISFLDNHRSRPVFLTLFIGTAHFPYSAPWPGYIKFTDPEYKGPYFFSKNPDLKASSDALTEADIAQARALYDGALYGVDGAIADFFAELQSRKRFDQAVIAITGDHGEELFDGLEPWQGHGEHLRGDQVTHTPLIVKGRRDTPPRRIPFLSRSIDIAPTLASMAGLQPPEGLFDGHDWTPWIRGKSTTDPQLAAYSETGIWFSRRGNVYFQRERLDYPGVSNLLSFNPSDSDQIILNPKYESLILTAKQRALTTSDHKMIYMPGKDAPRWELWQRGHGEKPDTLVDDPTIMRSLRERMTGTLKQWLPGLRVLGDYFVERT